MLTSRPASRESQSTLLLEGSIQICLSSSAYTPHTRGSIPLILKVYQSRRLCIHSKLPPHYCLPSNAARLLLLLQHCCHSLRNKAFRCPGSQAPQAVGGDSARDAMVNNPSGRRAIKYTWLVGLRHYSRGVLEERLLIASSETNWSVILEDLAGRQAGRQYCTGLCSSLRRPRLAFNWPDLSIVLWKEASISVPLWER